MILAGRARVSHIGERGLRSPYRGATGKFGRDGMSRYESAANVGVFFEMHHFSA